MIKNILALKYFQINLNKEKIVIVFISKFEYDQHFEIKILSIFLSFFDYKIQKV